MLRFAYIFHDFFSQGYNLQFVNENRIKRNMKYAWINVAMFRPVFYYPAIDDQSVSEEPNIINDGYGMEGNPEPQYSQRYTLLCNLLSSLNLHVANCNVCASQLVHNPDVFTSLISQIMFLILVPSFHKILHRFKVLLLTQRSVL